MFYKENEIKKVLNYNKCNNLYDTPLILPCGYSICSKCSTKGLLKQTNKPIVLNAYFVLKYIKCQLLMYFTDYFTSNEYKREINLVNPLGRKGEIAEAYADLVNEMWSGNNSFTMPRNFKVILVYYSSFMLIYF